jgi:hypothetical protein
LENNDGLRANPQTKQLWALQNEDGNPNLVIINPTTGTQTVYTFGPTPHGGGYDDIAFRGDNVFQSASNPATAGIVYAIFKNVFVPGAAYTATPNSVVSLDFSTGVITNIATGLVSPHGMAFITGQ